VACATLPAAMGLALAIVRTPAGPLRDWALIFARFLARCRILVTGFAP